MRKRSKGSAWQRDFQRLVDGSLALFCEAVDVSVEPPDWTAAREEIDRCRAQFTTTTDASAVEALSDSCLQACRQALALAAAQHAVKRAEVQSLIEHVRGAVSALVGDHETFSSRLDGSSERMAALAELNDLRRLKECLVVEVTSLKKIAAERRKSWASAVSLFESRVLTLESDLAASRIEASQDPLTGVANRRAFKTALHDSIQSASSPRVVVLVDVDDFKAINDTFGHMTGDDALVAVAQAIRSFVRADDLLARIGGDELACCCRGRRCASRRPACAN